MKKAIDYLGNIIKLEKSHRDYILTKKIVPYRIQGDCGVTSWSFQVKHWSVPLDTDESYVKPEQIDGLKFIMEDVVETLFEHRELEYIVSDNINLQTLTGERKWYYQIRA